MAWDKEKARAYGQVYSKSYRARNLEKLRANERARKRAQYIKHREKILAHRRVRYARDSNTSDSSKGLWAGKLKRKFGITPAEYAAILKSQQGQCAICEKPSTIRLAVDHDHATGQIRGLLCTACNRTIGQHRESPVWFQRALEYVIRHSQLKLVGGMK
jgi:hypothetical protein